MTLPLDPIKREAYLKAMSERVKGKSRSDEVKARISKTLKGRTSPMKGKHHTEEAKQKCREGSLGRLHTEDAKQKISAAQKGRTFSDETRQKMSDAKKGKPSSFKGKHLSDSAKQKLREANLGRKQSPETIEKRVSKISGKNHWTYGIRRTEEQKEKQRFKMIGIMAGEKNPFFGKHHDPETVERANETRRKTFAEHPEILEKMSQKGENHPRWQGGISFEPYCIKFNAAFKERVRAFFGYCCIECGTPQNREKLAIHHVHYLKDSCCSEDAPRYFVPLCKQCHAKTNANREYWEQHFTEIIETYYQGKCYLSEQEIKVIQSCA